MNANEAKRKGTEKNSGHGSTRIKAEKADKKERKNQVETEKKVEAEMETKRTSPKENTGRGSTQMNADLV